MSSKEENQISSKSLEAWRPSIIKTKRLFLRPLSLDDVMTIYNYARNPENVSFTGFPRPKSPKDTVKFVEDTVRRRYEERHEGEWGICLGNSGNAQLIGTIGCFFTGNERGIVELGYIIDQGYWGHGYTTEAAKAVRDWAFENYDIHRFQARCVAENIASWKVMEKLGMQCEGSLRQFFKRGDHYWDFKIYSILRKEWHQQFAQHR